MKVPLVSENIQYFLNEILSIDCPRCSLGFVLYRCSNNSSGHVVMVLLGLIDVSMVSECVSGVF